MTVRRLIELAEGREDWEITVRKHDKWQLCCNTTVPVKSAYPGLDWTHNQFILEPEVELVTSASEIDKAMSDKVADYSHRLTHHLVVAAQLARMIQEIPDEGLRTRIHEKLKEFK